MNKPQLSAEIEKRFDQRFNVVRYEQDGMLHHGFSNIAKTPSAKEIKHFLATTLEEQRQEILSDVNRIVRDVAQRNNIKIGTSLFGYRYEVCSELAKLNKLKKKK